MTGNTDLNYEKKISTPHTNLTRHQEIKGVMAARLKGPT